VGWTMYAPSWRCLSSSAIDYERTQNAFRLKVARAEIFRV
jgi:hypothetical protein